MNAIEIKNLNKSFLKSFPKGMLCFNLIYSLFSNFQKISFDKIPVLTDLSLNIPAGEVVGIEGPNGSGKSTLLRILAGIYTYDSGEIIINGKVLYISGYSILINRSLTVIENFYYVLSMYGLPRYQVEEAALPLLREVGLLEHLEQIALSLSDGQKARLGFAISYFLIATKNPDILILDEVFSGGGDKEFKLYSVEKIKKLIQGKTVLLVSHDHNLLMQACTLRLKINNGKAEKLEQQKKFTANLPN